MSKPWDTGCGEVGYGLMGLCRPPEALGEGLIQPQAGGELGPCRGPLQYRLAGGFQEIENLIDTGLGPGLFEYRPGSADQRGGQ